MSAGQAGRDPGSATTPEDFVELLRDIRADSGLSFWEIQKIAHDHGYDLEPAAMVHALGQPVLPAWEIVAGLLVSCGYRGIQIDGWSRVYTALAVRAVPQLDEEEAGAVVAPARRWTYQHVLYTASAGAVALFVLLIATTWDSEPAPNAALTSSSTGSPTQASAAVEPAGQRPSQIVASTPQVSAGSQPPPTQPGTQQAGTLTLASGQGVDLNTGQASGDLDIVATSGTSLTVGDNKKRLQVMPAMPTEQTCRSLNLGRLTRDVDDLTAGLWLCVHTSTGSWARVNITSTGDTITLSYLVWP